MSDAPQGPGWWMADDRLWYPPDVRTGTSTAPPASSPPSGPSARVVAGDGGPRWPRTPLLLVAGVIVVASGLGVAFVISRDDQPQASGNPASTLQVPASTAVASTSTSSTIPAITAAPTTVAAPPAPPAPPPPSTVAPSLADLPKDLKCADLKAMGRTYEEAARYWQGTGRPARMDEDGNSRPCETAYPAGDVTAYFGAGEPTYQGEGPLGSLDLPPGLDCKQLKSRGVPVTEAIAYYLDEGTPLRMDADGDGVPCETVYPDAEEVWNTSG